MMKIMIIIMKIKIMKMIKMNKNNLKIYLTITLKTPNLLKNNNINITIV